MNRVTYATPKPAPERSGPEYAAPAEAWLSATDSRLEIAYARTAKYFPDDKEPRDIYTVTLRRGNASYTFTFGQSIHCSTRFIRDPYGERIVPRRNKDYSQPDAYSILSSLESHNPGMFEDFCGDFGYDTDSRKAEATYKAVVEQYLSLARMYTLDELDKLGEIR